MKQNRKVLEKDLDDAISNLSILIKLLKLRIEKVPLSEEEQKEEDDLRTWTEYMKKQYEF